MCVHMHMRAQARACNAGLQLAQKTTADGEDEEVKEVTAFQQVNEETRNEEEQGTRNEERVRNEELPKKESKLQPGSSVLGRRRPTR